MNHATGGRWPSRRGGAKLAAMIDVRVPSSKSLTQRAMVLAALARGPSEISDPLDCDDSRALRRALSALGVRFTNTAAGFIIEGGGGLLPPPGPLNLENAGTATRFCAALALLAEGPVTIDGNDAMRRRPMPGLLQALRRLGAQVVEQGRPACPPVTITSPTNLVAVPATVALDAAGSSQQLSALLLVAPRLPSGLEITLTGDLPSRPYVDLTVDALADFGVVVETPLETDMPAVYRVPPAGLRASQVTIEGDHSSASYPLAAGWLTGQPVRVLNTRPDSRQGDLGHKRISTTRCRVVRRVRAAPHRKRVLMALSDSRNVHSAQAVYRDCLGLVPRAPADEAAKHEPGAHRVDLRHECIAVAVVAEIGSDANREAAIAGRDPSRNVGVSLPVHDNAVSAFPVRSADIPTVDEA